jgi:hypothetical protein
MEWKRVSMREALLFCRGKDLADERAYKKHIPDPPYLKDDNHLVWSIEQFTDGTAVAGASSKCPGYSKYTPSWMTSPEFAIYTIKE